jgi:hypothetical protein
VVRTFKICLPSSLAVVASSALVTCWDRDSRRGRSPWTLAVVALGALVTCRDRNSRRGQVGCCGRWPWLPWSTNAVVMTRIAKYGTMRQTWKHIIAEKIMPAYS